MTGLYISPITIKKNLTAIKAKVFGDGFLPSQSVGVTFIKDGLPIASTSQPAPVGKYTGNGKQGLFDNLGGVADVDSKYWLGYQTDLVEVIINLQKKQRVSSVLLNLLQNHNAWVFLPQQVNVYAANHQTNTYVLCSQKTFNEDAANAAQEAVNILLPLHKKVKTKQLKIVIVPLQIIPVPHAGSGKPSWLFIDEIKVY